MKYLVVFNIFICSLFASSSALHVESKHRYFGGLSEVKAKLPKSVMLTPSTIMTEEVFSANDTKEVEIAVTKQKEERVLNKEEVKDFAMERTGHLYGGISERSLKY